MTDAVDRLLLNKPTGNINDIGKEKPTTSVEKVTDPISIHGDNTVKTPEDSVKIDNKKEETKKEEKSWWAKLKDAIFGEDKPANKTEDAKETEKPKEEEKGFWANLKDILFGDDTNTQSADNKTSDTTVSNAQKTDTTKSTTNNIDLNKIKELQGKQINRELVEKIKASDSLSAEQKAELKNEIIAEMSKMGINTNELTEEKFDAFVRIMQFQNLDHKNVKERRATLRNEVTRENYKQFIANHPELTDDQKKQLERQFNIDGILEKVALKRATKECTAEEAAEVYLQASKDTEELRKASIEALANEMKKDKVSGKMQEIFVTSSEKTSEVVLDSVETFAKSDRCPESLKQKLLDTIAKTKASIKTNSSALVETLKERAEKNEIHYAEELKEIEIKKEQQQEERKISKTKLENAEWKIWLVMRKIYALTCEIIKKMGQSYTVKDQDLKALNPELFAEWQNALSLKETVYWEDYDVAAKGRLLDNAYEITEINFSSAATTSAILSRSC